MMSGGRTQAALNDGSAEQNGQLWSSEVEAIRVRGQKGIKGAGE